eukprot:CAMPEP_0172503138 /NCGR_PEP_ID=MMETSP1066-20121228/166445_1 /TAXON_ID=671091 /ORGANISM="Coscinodiscus wailesii, Strain CCMP2513" /LENGTH=85 /DNA_ID=CAMNT_0013278747 /DNA_START=786 /DNA_END=1039 /DNA_ORIENTATION=-
MPKKSVTGRNVSGDTFSFNFVIIKDIAEVMLSIFIGGIDFFDCFVVAFSDTPLSPTGESIGIAMVSVYSENDDDVCDAFDRVSRR